MGILFWQRDDPLFSALTSVTLNTPIGCGQQKRVGTSWPCHPFTLIRSLGQEPLQCGVVKWKEIGSTHDLRQRSTPGPITCIGFKDDLLYVPPLRSIYSVHPWQHYIYFYVCVCFPLGTWLYFNIQIHQIWFNMILPAYLFRYSILLATYLSDKGTGHFLVIKKYIFFCMAFLIWHS